MARGFGGETTEQEARGIDNSAATDSSMASVASGRADAATSAALGGRDVDPGGGGDNDYTPKPAVDMSPGRMQAMYGNNPLATQLAGINQQKFNQARGITSLNPYGKDGFFSRFLGIDPKNVDYSNIMDQRTRGSIANNQYSKFMNPQNLPTLPGYNRDYPTAERGQLRSGVQKAGYETAFGPVMKQARQQDIGEMTARGLAGMFGGLPGLALGQIGTQEYGLPGQPGFDSFDPNNPRPGGGILGQFLGGLNPTQAKDALVGAFAPVAPAPKPTSIGTPTGFEEKRSLHPLTGETGTKTFGDPLSDMYGYNMQASPEEISLVDGTTAGFLDTVAPTEAGQYNFNPAYDLSTQPSNPFGTSFDNIAPRGSLSPDELDSLIQNSTTQTASGGQLAGLFGENPKAAGFRDLEGMIKSVVDGENLPDDQNMYGPGMPNQTPLTPDELNNLLEPYGMKLGRGPSSGGIMQLAV